mmetsp:Transcript_123070/g.344502  ORF Transcript_123070/g.344502 Transcript_123070/m.344502 type:complete len:226 (+) Transcript_123070:270-947(+)
MELSVVIVQRLGRLAHVDCDHEGPAKRGSLLHSLRRHEIHDEVQRRQPHSFGFGLVLLVEDSRARRHSLSDITASTGAFTPVVPSRNGDALLLACLGDRVHSRSVVCRDELFRACRDVHVLLPHVFQEHGEDRETDLSHGHHHPDRPDGLGFDRERHRGGVVLQNGCVPDTASDRLLRSRDVRIVLLALLPVISGLAADGEEGRRQRRPRLVSQVVAGPLGRSRR